MKCELCRSSGIICESASLWQTFHGGQERRIINLKTGKIHLSTIPIADCNPMDVLTNIDKLGKSYDAYVD